jgi:hypothetical protein
MNAESETKRLSSKAVGFMNAGDILNKAMSARYPLAPPCPTDAYRKATTNRSNMKRS